MTELTIPEHAIDLAWRAFGAHEDDYVAALTDAISAAAPTIVAAELRRLADDLYTTERWPLSKVGTLHLRANEIDPPGDKTR
jgi:hypothetical protein